MDLISKTYKTNFIATYNNYIMASEVKDFKNIKSITPIETNDNLKEIKFKFYKEHITLRKHINRIILTKGFSSNEMILEQIFENIGQFIATFHIASKTSKSEKFYLDKQLHKLDNNFCSFLHSDLTDNNILINKKNEVVIIDWESAPIKDYFFNYGNILWDLVWFSNSIIRPSPGTFFNTNARMKLVDFFLKGYLQINNFDINAFFTFYHQELEGIIEEIYKKKNLYNNILLEKHRKNWKELEKKLCKLV